MGCDAQLAEMQTGMENVQGTDWREKWKISTGMSGENVQCGKCPVWKMPGNIGGCLDLHAGFQVPACISNNLCHPG